MHQCMAVLSIVPLVSGVIDQILLLLSWLVWCVTCTIAAIMWHAAQEVEPELLDIAAGRHLCQSYKLADIVRSTNFVASRNLRAASD